MPGNKIAWVDAVGKDVVVREGEIPKPGPSQVVIRNRAVAINPIDWKQQALGINVKAWPLISGFDVAGEVHELGSNVDRFRPGDRVVARALGKGFQEYVVVEGKETASLPASIPFVNAAVLPTAFSTALTGLTGQLNAPPPGVGLALPPPSLTPKPSGKTVLVWGGSSSVGSMTIQMATAAGVKAVAVAGAHNFGISKDCGAVEVLDYNSESIVEDAVQAIRTIGGEFAGVLDSVCTSSSITSVEKILEALGGGAVVVTNPIQAQPASDKVQRKFFTGSGSVGTPFYHSYLEPALRDGKVKTLPQPLVVGKSLDDLQHAYELSKKGVSGKKLVLDLSS